LGLRAQLIFGLALSLLVVAVSVGVITLWSTGHSRAAEQLSQATAHGKSVALLLASAPRGAEADRLVSSLVRLPLALRLDLYDRMMRRVAHAALPGEAEAWVELARRALRTQEQQTRLAPNSEWIDVATPLPRHVGGACLLRVPLAPSGATALPTSYWVLMAVDGLLLLLFVGFIITRYVATPVEALQAAAARVAAGDLEVRLDERGAQEFASLAASFNRMTKSLVEQQRSLVRAERLASVGQLAAGVAHEIGNPLQGIIGLSDVLLLGELEDKPREVVARVQSEAGRIHQIVGQLLEYSRPVEGKKEPVDVSASVEQALALVRPQQHFRGVVVDGVKLLERCPPVAASNTRLVQVLVNLLLNAAHALNGEGRVVFSWREEGQRVSLHIANDGPPISCELRERVFVPFFTTKSPGQGTGLGLSVSQSIVESYGGTLSLADDDEHVLFIITLWKWQADAEGS